MSVPVELMRVISEMATSSLLAAIWQGVLLAAAAGIGLRLLPRTPAGVRFAIWFAVFAVVMALPLVELGRAATGVTTGGYAAWLTLPEGWSFGIATVWVAASAWRGISLATAAVRVRALWKRARPVELPGAAELLDHARRAQICVSDEVDRPSVIGFFAPKILIPGWLLEKLTPEEIAHVVLHEAGHLRRADDWLNLLQKMALVVFPLNPALVWIERRLCFERELACDERVLRATRAPKAYASCLAALAEHRMNRRSAALVMAALGRESELGQRVARILARGEGMRPRQAGLVMGAAVLMLTAGAAGLEHCPELVGFGGSPESLALPVNAAAVRAPVGAGYAAENVVFHPAVPARSLPVKAKVLAAKGSAAAVQVEAAAASVPLVARTEHANDSAAHATAVVGRQRADGRGLVSTPVMMKTVAQRPADMGARLLRAAAAPLGDADGQVGWVVMTAWKMADGSTVMMTSVVGPGGSSQPLVARPVSAEPCAGHEDEQEERVGQDGSPVVSHYAAAVPVRDGWLVVQL